MSLAGAMNTAVSALLAQSQALSIVSNNLANSSTVGYKSVTTSFHSLVTQEYTTGQSFSGGGVSATARQNVSAQGEINSTTTTTDLAIDGNGFFVVANASGELFYTRNGEFDFDDEGNLCFGDYYVQGYICDEDGTVDSTSKTTLTTINVNDFAVDAPQATSIVTMKANLPSDLDYTSTSNTVTQDIEVIDSLGVTHTVTLTFTKTNVDSTTGESTWTIDAADEDGNSVTVGTLTFDSSGELTAQTDSSGNSITLGSTTSYLTIDCTAFSWGTYGTSVNFDISASGSMTQYSDGTEINLDSLTQDGYEKGELSSITIDSDGVVYATYDNGDTRPIYVVAMATFVNESGLTCLSNSLYQASNNSGLVNYTTANTDGAGSITSSALESSTVDTGDEFTRMIVAQQAYSAASQVISTSSDMFDDLIAAVR